MVTTRDAATGAESPAGSRTGADLARVPDPAQTSHQSPRQKAAAESFSFALGPDFDSNINSHLKA